MVRDACGNDYPLSDVLLGMPEAWHGEIAKLYDLCAEYDVDITQIKIKYGGLRFYVGSAPELVHNAIEKAEQICFDKKLIY